MSRAQIRPLFSRSSCSLFRHTTCAPRRLSSTTAAPPDVPITAALPTRWLSDLKLRIGKCIIFGLDREHVDEAGRIMKIVARDWRELLAGSEGFLTGRGKAGFERRDVEWGEMVSELTVGSNDMWLGEEECRGNVTMANRGDRE